MDLNNKEKEDIIKSLSNNLPTLRKQLDLSQKDLADKLNISRQTIVNIENNKSNMNWITAFSILMFFVLNPLSSKLLKPLGILTDKVIKDSNILDALGSFISNFKKK